MNIPPDRSKSTGNGPNWSRINQWLLWLGLAAAVAWMFYRHNAHLLQLLPFLFILACPLMHIFGHGSHGAHGGHDHQDQPPRGDEGARLRANQTTGAARNPSTSPGTTTETTGASSWKPSNSRLPA